MTTSIIQADARKWLEEAALAAPRYACIITDPPYWTLDKWRNVGTTTRLGGHHDPEKRDETKWFPTIDREDLYDCLCAMLNLLVDDAHAYIFADHEVMPILLGWVREGDLHDIVTYSKPLVWDKVNPGMGYHYRAQHEYVVFLQKGKRKLKDLSTPDVFRVKRVTGGYPTEKPVDLLKIFMLQSTEPGECILDPFCGSGSTGVAAMQLGRHATLVDIEARAIAATTKRTDEEASVRTLFDVHGEEKP